MALSKLKEYLDEINRLSAMKYDEGENGKFKLDVKIRSFIQNAFDEPDEKIQDYNNNVNWYFESIGIKKTEQQEQEDYLDRLNTMKSYLESYQEEIQMFLDNNQVNIETERKSNEVFIIYGHERVALLDLERMLKQRWSLKTIILMDEPGRGRTLIEKFEEEAKKAAYAFAILTPDDMIRSRDSSIEYLQPRPNVIFELGRQKVCILNRKGAEIHSDLRGISHIQFNESVLEKVTEIENELKAGKLI